MLNASGLNQAGLNRMSARQAVPLLLAAVAAAYAGSLGNGFTYDDFQVIVGNPFILSWANLRDVLSLRYLETSGELSYRPLVSLSYMAAVLPGRRPLSPATLIAPKFSKR